VCERQKAVITLRQMNPINACKGVEEIERGRKKFRDRK
jgi:hypothetical protein